MTTLLYSFVPEIEYESYQEFIEKFEIKVPENFNFAYDIVDKYAEISPDKTALVWCNEL